MDFIFYVIFTPILAVTANKIMFASENTMLAQDAVNRVQSIIDMKPLEYVSQSQNIDSYDIEFKNVTFQYPGTTEKVLKNINLKIKEGQTVAFVGPSGGGKTTLLSLIPRFYDVTEGQIFIGGKDVRELSEDVVMNNMSFVFQDSHLLQRSIYENIKMGQDVSDQDIEYALKQAQCEDIISILPKGIHTEIGKEGTYVSGGEAQRLMIARAFLKNAPILLMDEATAFADPDNEVMIQQSLSNLSKGKTTIMIAHRLSTIQHVDCIYVLDQGEIVESGTHQELLAHQGVYTKMWNDYCHSVDWKLQEKEGKV